MLIACPACNKSIPDFLINSHLDKDCRGLNEEEDEENKAPKRKVESIAEPEVIKTNNTSKRHKISNAVENAQPLAEMVRPTTLDEYKGQKELIGPGGLLRLLIESDKVPSMILWGPSGTGKTTLARIIARMTKSNFKELSATMHNLSDVRKEIEEAKNLLALTGQQTILFVDELHRMSRSQQDVFLPYVEKGTIKLIGATTENPSFKIVSALLSRCRVFVLHQLSVSQVEEILSSAIRRWFDRNAPTYNANTALDSETINFLAQMSDGDARVALNVIDMALWAQMHNGTFHPLNKEDIKRALQKTHLVFDRQGEAHYNTISALHKSIRGSDADASLYWLGRLLEGGEDPLYIARRLVRAASEDIGLADNNALQIAVSAYQACSFIGMPECDCILAHCVVYLARAPKSVEVYKAYGLVKKTISEEIAYPVPLHIRNAPTKLMKELNYGKGYKYNPDYDEPVEQEYLPPELKRRVFLNAREKSGETNE